MNFEQYIGIPYVEKGRDGSGVDCWGLVRLIYKNEYNIDLPSFSSEYTVDDDARIGELFAQYKEGWEHLDVPEAGNVVLFRMFGTDSHIGVLVSPTHFIHVREGRDSVIEALNSTKWAKRISGYYKYSEKYNVVLNAVPHPLKTERYTVPIVPGTTITELVSNISSEHNIAQELKSRISVLVNGMVVPQESWSNTIIKLGDVIEYRAVPGKEALRLVAVVALTYYAPYLAGSLTGYTSAAAAATVMGGSVTVGLTALNMAATAAIFLAGSALINALAPIRAPAEPRDPGSSERQLMVTGGSNQINPYGAIPVILGKVRVTPLLGSTNFLTYENERDSYLSMLLVWGYGPIYIDDSSYKIGDVPLTSFTDYTKINLTRISEPSFNDKLAFDSIYGKDVVQINTAVELVCPGNPEVSVVPGPWFEAATDIEYDVSTQLPVPISSVTVAIHFPQGLRGIKSKGQGAGDYFAVNIEFNLEYSINNGATWAYLDTFNLGNDSAKKDGFTYTKTYNGLNQNQLIIRARRATGTNVEDNPNHRYYFTSILQSVTFLRNSTPAVDPVGAKIAKTAFKIKATDQLNGNIQGISAVVQTWCKIWNGSAWVDGKTSNPAALMRYVLEHPANPRRITSPSTQINLTQLQQFYNYCELRGLEYNGILGNTRSVLEVIRDICAAGRGSPALVDGKWTVIIDTEKPNVVQHFTAHNSWGFEGSKSLPKRPDGLRVTYYDQDRDYQESEIIVYEVGKDTTNASLFESIALPGVTKKSLVIDHARWHLAQMKLRPEVYTLNCDIEYLVCNRGDRVKVMHDVPMWGIASGRIKNIISPTVIELDELVPLNTGTPYTIRFRSKTGTSTTRTVASILGGDYYNTITLTSPITSAQADVGDLFLFGTLEKESQDLLVLSIEPSSNNSARITLVDYGVTPDYNIFTQYSSLSASTVFESQITLPPTLQLDSFGRKTPQITAFVSDESVMERVAKGVFKYNINVSYVNASNLPTNTDTVEVQYDLLSSDTGVNSRSVFVPFQNGSANLTDVKDGETYKVRMRYVSRVGRLGDWSVYSNHTVIGKRNPPSSVTQFQAASDKSSGQILLTWADNPEADTYTYEIRLQDNSWGSNDTQRVFFGDSTRCFAKYLGTSYTNFYIKAIDSSGNYSLNAEQYSYVPAPIPDITEIRHSYADTALTSATVTLEWDDVETSEFNIAYYEVIYDAVIRTVKGNSTIIPANWIGERLFTIKTVDVHGNKSSGYSSSIIKYRPGSPADVKTQVIDNNVMLYWTLPTRTSLPIDHILIKKGIAWDTAQIIGEKKGEFTTINELRGGEITYWLACVDTEGVKGDPVSVKTSVSEPPDFVFNNEFIDDFSGTAVNAEFDGISLVMPVNNIESFSDHFVSRGWDDPEDQVSAGFPIYIQPSVNSGYYEQIFDFQQPLSSSRVTFTYQGSVVAGDPIVSYSVALSLDNITYTVFEGVTEVFGNNFRYVKIRIKVDEPTNLGLYSIQDIRVRSDAKIKSDAGNSIAVVADTLGTIVNFNKEFIDVQSVTLSPSGTTSANAVYDIKDAFETGTYNLTSNVCTVTKANHGLITGQSVKLFISSGSGVAGLYIITSYTANTFTVDMVSADTSGDISYYPQSFRVYLFDNSGNRVYSRFSWAIKGY
jgi:sulfur carrier protein ThiS